MEEERIHRISRELFGIESLMPYQQLVITNIVEGIEEGCEPRDQLVILPTGYGKSLCFMVPGMIFPGLTLVIYPLLSLINDQKRRLCASGIPVIVLQGGEARGQRDQQISYIAAREHGFILTTPESLETPRVKKLIKDLPIRHAVVDEAHIVSSWGKGFRPAYARLGKTLEGLKISQMTAFTATAAAETIEDIRELLFLGRTTHLIREVPDRPNIFYSAVFSLAKKHELEQLLCSPEISRPILVFCSRRDTTERLAIEFCVRLRSSCCRYYHAGMDRQQRDSCESWFAETSEGILFSTTAFGLGVDISGIRTVIHFTCAATTEAFLQESGRAGRDRGPALSIVLFDHEDLQDKRISEHMRRYLTGTGCRRDVLLEQFTDTRQPCFGCDCCRGTDSPEAEGSTEILRFIRRHRQSFSISEASSLLVGECSLPIRRNHLYLLADFGCLSSWQLDDIETALGSLIGMQLLQKDRRGRLFYTGGCRECQAFVSAGTRVGGMTS